MRKLIIISGITAATVLLVIGVSLFSLYEASQLVPPFYHEAICLAPAEQEDARDQFVAQLTALASDLHRKGHWQSLFTQEQINAWLALEMSANYPDLLPSELREPRITIQDKEATIACRYETADMAAVLSLTVDAYLQEPNVLALRIRRARAGALPVPLAHLLDGISRAAEQLNLRLQWRKAHGDPVALITFPSPASGQADALRLDAVELRNGELFVSGTIGPVSSDGSPSEPQPAPRPTASNEPHDDPQAVVGSAEKETVQK